MRHGEGLRREPQSSTIPTPRITRNHETWALLHRTGGTYFQNCNGNSDVFYLGIAFPDSVDFQCWEVNFKTEVCANTRCLVLTISWIKEMKTATSIDDLMTS